MILLGGGVSYRLELLSSLYSLCELVRPGADFRPNMYYLPDAEAPVVDGIVQKQVIIRRMQVFGIPAANTTLLYGEPGTGKTEIAVAFWDVLSIQPPFSIAEYAGNDYTPSCIHTNMVKELAAYLETHPEDTPVEAAVEHEIIIPAHRAETFLLAADKLRMQDNPCAEMEKSTFCIARIATDLSLPEAEEKPRGNPAVLCGEGDHEAIIPPET